MHRRTGHPVRCGGVGACVRSGPAGRRRPPARDGDRSSRACSRPSAGTSTDLDRATDRTSVLHHQDQQRPCGGSISGDPLRHAESTALARHHRLEDRSRPALLQRVRDTDRHGRAGAVNDRPHRRSWPLRRMDPGVARACGARCRCCARDDRRWRTSPVAARHLRAGGDQRRARRKKHPTRTCCHRGAHRLRGLPRRCHRIIERCLPPGAAPTRRLRCGCRLASDVAGRDGRDR